jgi:hypothetical protein
MRLASHACRCLHAVPRHVALVRAEDAAHSLAPDRAAHEDPHDDAEVDEDLRERRHERETKGSRLQTGVFVAGEAENAYPTDRKAIRLADGVHGRTVTGWGSES